MYEDDHYDRNTNSRTKDTSRSLGNRISKNRHSGGGRSSGDYGMSRKYDYRANYHDNRRN